MERPTATMAVLLRRMDFFISHAGRDQVWAEWLAWQLIEAGYTVELDVWDWTPGQDFVARMQGALRQAERLLVVWSEAYFLLRVLARHFGGDVGNRRPTVGRTPQLDVPTLVPPAR